MNTFNDNTNADRNPDPITNEPAHTPSAQASAPRAAL